MQHPQSGVRVGAAAHVELCSCVIARCTGPAVKVYRGRLHARDSTIAFSCRGANVVANGGHVALERSEISFSGGDGVASWNDCTMSIEHNSIHANAGCGILVNTGSGSVAITDNAIFDNARKPLFFTMGKPASCSLRGNRFVAPAGGGNSAVEQSTTSEVEVAPRPSQMPSTAAAKVGASDEASDGGSPVVALGGVANKVRSAHCVGADAASA